MKNSPVRSLVLVSLALVPFAWGAVPAPKEQKEMRVITRTERPGPGPRRPIPPGEKETVAFLGVQAAPASRTVAVQLGLPAGSGLVVNHVVPDSPAAGVLEEHDILLKLDDQILIETRQLSVLIRQHKEGDEVTLTYLRGGKQATARVKLGRQEVPKMTGWFEHAVPGGPLPGFGGAPGPFRMMNPERSREEVDRVLSLIGRGPRVAPMRIEAERRVGPGMRMLSVSPANSTLSYSDDDGSLELTIKDGVKSLVARDAQGEQLFAGPVNSPEERRKMPPPVRERLEKLEGMQNITFHTDEEFRGAETRVLPPPGRGISLPPHRAGPPPRGPQHF